MEISDVKPVNVDAAFLQGWEASKLDTFLYLTREGKPFLIYEPCYRWIVPLIVRRLRELGVAVSVKEENPYGSSS